MKNILVAGAGPAGLVAAIKLARTGKRITLLAPSCEVKNLGQSVPAAINRLLSGLDLPSIDSRCGIHTRVGGAVSLWAGKNRIEDYLNRAEGHVWRLDKAKFMETVFNIVKATGVKRSDNRIRHVSTQSESHISVQLDNGQELTFDFIVDATGRNAIISSKLNVNRIQGPALVAHWMIGDSNSVQPTNRTLVESVPNGWWYGAVLPMNRPIAIYLTAPENTVALKRDSTTWKASLARTQLISKHLPPEAFPDSQTSVTKATPELAECCFGNRWASCGDAALSLDPLSSQGILNGMATGSMVADALLGTDRPQCLQDYQRQVQEIARISETRRQRLYESAYGYFRTEFWKQSETSKLGEKLQSLMTPIA